MRRELLLLEEMAEAAEQAHRLATGVTAGALAEDRMRRKALLWNLTVLGEAASQVPADLRERYPDVPWRQPVRLRNRVVHGYWSIDLQVLHTTALTQLPGVAAQIRHILSAMAEEDRSGS